MLTKIYQKNSSFYWLLITNAVSLIKKDTYILGDDNKEITKEDISRAVNLSKLSIILFTITVIVLFTLIYVIL